MWIKGKYGDLAMLRSFGDDLLMASMDTIEDAYRY